MQELQGAGGLGGMRMAPEALGVVLAAGIGVFNTVVDVVRAVWCVADGNPFSDHDVVGEGRRRGQTSGP